MAKVTEKFIKLGMSKDMERQINDWIAANRDPETGKAPNFSEACRQLIARGLDADPPPE